ncbi:MAG: hypothetical protein PHR30_09835 [Gallionellaceae bacterium]|nr:hypothetical protein [Gallionellaceae bacterium]MDD5365628.1 hypothetical protein [Gallionellaceae bacterium]
MTPHDHQAIAEFARNALGCGCEEAVFRSISLDSGRLADDPVPFARIVIGQRLLIYLVRAVPGRPWPDRLPALAEAGRRERDAQAYNRFRLVLADGDASALAPLFVAATGADEKAHLHVVPESSWPPPVLRLP